MKKTFKFFMLIFSIMLLSGCFNYKEINNYAIVSGISIDLDDEDPSKYVVGIQIMNAKKDEESDNSLITFYKTKGKTIYQALEKIMLDSPKELYLGHNEVVVINEELAKEKDPLDYLDYFMRDSEVEKDALIMIAKENKAYEILKIITPLETIPSRNLKSTLAVADNFSGTLTVVTIDEFISDLIENGKQPVAPTITITGDVNDGDKMENIAESDPESKLKFDTLAYFQDNRLKGYLSNEESIGYNFLSGEEKETYVNVKCDSENYATMRVINSKIDQKLSFKNGKPYVKITTKINANLLEYNCRADFIESEKYVKELQKKYAKKIEQIMKKATNKLYIENKADVLDYGDKFYKKKYSEMKKYNYKKEEIVNDISFKFDVNVEIKSTELTIKSVKGASSYD